MPVPGEDYKSQSMHVVAEQDTASLCSSTSSAVAEEFARHWPRVATVQAVLRITKALGLFSGVATLGLFIFLCVERRPSLHVDSADFFSDVNAATWRARFFSLDCDVLFDVWTPFVMGLLAILVHFESFRCLAITCNWIRFGLWNLALALFGNLGYCGILGIAVGVISLTVASLSLILFLFHAGPAHLWGNNKLYLSTSRVPPWYSLGAGYWPCESVWSSRTSSAARPIFNHARTASAFPTCTLSASNRADAVNKKVLRLSHATKSSI